MFIKLKMLLISYLLFSCISYASSASKKSIIFTIVSPTTLERKLESFLNYKVELHDEASLKNILLSYLQRDNGTKSNETSTEELESSKLELTDTYISFGSVSAMLTNLTYVDFSQLTGSSVDIIMKVQEGSVQRNVQINSTIKSEKMTFVGDVTLLGSKYQFTINLIEPTFRLNKHISETSSSITTIQSEIFTFELMTTNLQPKDYHSFLIGKSGLNDSILQRMADSWLPPIVESLKKNSMFNKSLDYENKILTSDGRTSFNYRICHWLQGQRDFSVHDVRIFDAFENLAITDIMIWNIGSYETCNGDFSIDKETNNYFISLNLQYSYLSFVTLNQTEYFPTPPAPSDDSGMYTTVEPPTLSPPIIRQCLPITVGNIKAKIKFNIEKETNKITEIRNTSIEFVPRFSMYDNVCSNLISSQTPVVNFLQKKITDYLTTLLIE